MTNLTFILMSVNQVCGILVKQTGMFTQQCTSHFESCAYFLNYALPSANCFAGEPFSELCCKYIFCIASITCVASITCIYFGQSIKHMLRTDVICKCDCIWDSAIYLLGYICFVIAIKSRLYTCHVWPCTALAPSATKACWQTYKGPLNIHFAWLPGLSNLSINQSIIYQIT